MNKSEFLNELEKRIRILEKNEIDDILAEYSQHIDMRIQSGFTESEAIKDFGSIEELTAEILEAYHVNPEYEREKEISAAIPKTVNKLFEKLKESKLPFGALAVLVLWIKKILNYIEKGVKKLSGTIKGLFIKLTGVFKREKSSDITLCETGLTEQKKELSQFKFKRNKAYKKGTKSYFREALKKLLFACLVVLVVLCLIPVGFVGIVSVFSFGVALVFLIQGYPVIGVLIVLSGLSLCSISVGGLLLSLIVKPKKPVNEDEESAEEEETSLEETNGEVENK